MSDQAQTGQQGQQRRGQTPPLDPLGVHSGSAGDPVEALARDIYIQSVKGTLTSGFTATHLAEQAFEQATAFCRVADLRRVKLTGMTQKKDG